MQNSKLADPLLSQYGDTEEALEAAIEQEKTALAAAAAADGSSTTTTTSTSTVPQLLQQFTPVETRRYSEGLPSEHEERQDLPPVQQQMM